MTDAYLSAVRAHLGRLSGQDRRRALDALSAQLGELADAGIDPATALGDPACYATHLQDALTEETSSEDARWRILGMPVETRGPVSTHVRSRTWDPASPRLFVPRLFGIGWTLNLGALAVRLGLIRPDDVSDDVLARIPQRDLRLARAVPIVIAGATATALALAWRGLPPIVASGFGFGGRPRGEAPRWTLIGAVALGAAPALWARRRNAPAEERLVRTASTTSLAVISAGVVAATIAQARAPRGRWGLLTAAALPVAVAASLAVLVVPLRSGLRRAWRTASASTSPPLPPTRGDPMNHDLSSARMRAGSIVPNIADAQDVTVHASGLSKRFGDREVVSGLSFSVAQGHAFGLLGPNGSGKTTTVRLLTGLLTPDSGDTTLFGESVNPANADLLRRRISVQTDTNLYETLSARENLRTWGALYGIGRNVLDKRIDEVLNVLDLHDRASSLVGEFSKGMRQKLAVGRAVLHEPELLFLDEPTAGLDPEASADLIDYLKQMIRSLNTTVIICTHQLHGLESLCDDIGILRNGQLLASGAVDELLRRKWPEHQYSLTVGADIDRAQQIVASVTGSPPTVDTDGRLLFSTSDEGLVPAVVAALVRDDIPVHAVIPTSPTIEQFYFATLDEEGIA